MKYNFKTASICVEMPKARETGPLSIKWYRVINYQQFHVLVTNKSFRQATYVPCLPR